MSIQSELDWRGLRAVGKVVRLTLDALETHTAPGVTTGELDGIAATVLAAHGARSAPSMVYGFPGTVLISVNDEVVHGIPGSRKLCAGDIVKLDVTVEKDGYMADAARTVVLDGESASPQRTRSPGLARALRQCAVDAFQKGLQVARAGRRVREIGAAVDAEVTRCGFRVIRELGGHGIGRTIHERPSVPNYCDRLQNDVLTEGLVITIEPIICAGSARLRTDRDRWTIRTADGSLAAHYEHTIVITRDRPVLLTAFTT